MIKTLCDRCGADIEEFHFPSTLFEFHEEGERGIIKSRDCHLCKKCTKLFEKWLNQ